MYSNIVTAILETQIEHESKDKVFEVILAVINGNLKQPQEAKSTSSSKSPTKSKLAHLK